MAIGFERRISLMVAAAALAKPGNDPALLVSLKSGRGSDVGEGATGHGTIPSL